MKVRIRFGMTSMKTAGWFSKNRLKLRFMSDSTEPTKSDIDPGELSSPKNDHHIPSAYAAAPRRGALPPRGLTASRGRGR